MTLPDPFLIGLAGAAGAGKDTVADWLVAHHGFERHAFADPMKAMLEALFAELGIDHAHLHERGLKEMPLPGLHVSARHLMQTLGTEWGRAHLGANWWVKCTELMLGLNDLPRSAPVHDRIVITDVRFPEEASWIRSHGGVIVRVQRAGATPIPLATHASETQYIRADRILQNDGSLADLHDRVDLLAASLLGA